MVKSFKKQLKKNNKKNKKSNKQLIKHRGGDNSNVSSITANNLKKSGSGKELLEICRDACNIMQPMIEAFYNKINYRDKTGLSPEQSKKDDKSDFTVVDGLVQYFLQYILFDGKFEDVIGEEDLGEDGKYVNINTPHSNGNYYVITGEPVEGETDAEKLFISPEFNDYINGENSIKTKLLKLKEEKFKDINYKDKYVVIDPIDGTTEFTTKHGQQSTICIGFSNVEDGLPWAGIVYRPIPPSDKEPYDYTYIYGCKSEQLCICKKSNESDEKTYEKPTITPNTLLTSNKDLSPFLMSIIDTPKTNWSRINSGGAGNKMLKVLEGIGEAYIQDRGLSRWDTCAAQAIIEATGGICCKLTNFLSNGDFISYIYKKSEVNRDFNLNTLNKPQFTPYNINDEYKQDLLNFITNGLKSKNLSSKMKPKEVINTVYQVRTKVLNYGKKTLKKNLQSTNNKKLSNYENKTKSLAENLISNVTNNLYKEFTETHYKLEYYKAYSNLSGIVAFLDPTKKIDYFNLCKAAEAISLPEFS